jgi:hypothetical protein
MLAGLMLVLAGCQPDAAVTRAVGQAEPMARLALIGAGVLFLVAGYAVSGFLISLVGFLAGGVAGALVVGQLANGDTLITLVGVLVLGGVGAALATSLAMLAVFAAGFLAGAAMTGGLWLSLFHADPATWAVVAVGIVGGMVMLALYRLWLTALTAALGAALIGYVTGAHPAFWVALFIIGVAIQYGLASATGRGHEARPGYGSERRKGGGSGPPALRDRLT